MKKFKQFLALLLSFVMVISVIPSINVEAATKKLSKMSGKQVIKTLKDNGFPIDSYNVYTTNIADPNHLIGKPHQYKCKVNFWDKDYLNTYSEYSGTFEIFKNSADASARKKYLKSIYELLPSDSMRMYQFSNVLLRIDYSVPNKRAKYYKNAFSSMSKGKTPKFPLSINKKNVSLEEGKSLTLKLNVPSKKATWKSSNKKVATVSKSGKITAKKNGTTTITAKYNGYTVKCKVKVIDQNPLNKWFGTVKSNVNIQTKSFVYYDESDEIYCDFGNPTSLDYATECVGFQIYNGAPKKITIGNEIKVYDDYYDYIGSMSMDEYSDCTIDPNDESYVCFADFSDEYLLYYAQRLIFEIEIEGATIYCYAEYTYDDNAPYSFSFHKTIENDDDDDL